MAAKSGPNPRGKGRVPRLLLNSLRRRNQRIFLVLCSLMQRLLTGLQPSGALHIGNYFGVLKPFAEMYEKYESHLMVADYHALTTLKNPEELPGNIMNVVRDYVAVGIDPKKAIIFQQSQVPQHTELTWIFNTLVTMAF